MRYCWMRISVRAFVGMRMGKIQEKHVVRPGGNRFFPWYFSSISPDMR